MQVKEEFKKLSNAAKMKLIKDLIGTMGPSLVRAIIKVSCIRLDAINSALPKDHPNYQRYQLYSELRRKKALENDR